VCIEQSGVQSEVQSEVSQGARGTAVGSDLRFTELQTQRAADTLEAQRQAQRCSRPVLLLRRRRLRAAHAASTWTHRQSARYRQSHTYGVRHTYGAMRSYDEER